MGRVWRVDPSGSHLYGVGTSNGKISRGGLPPPKGQCKTKVKPVNGVEDPKQIRIKTIIL